MTPEQLAQHDAQAIDAREKLNAWISLPIVEQRFKELEHSIYNEFRAADTDAKRTAAWMRAQAMQDLLGEIKGIQSSGVLALSRLNTRAEQAARAERTPAHNS